MFNPDHTDRSAIIAQRPDGKRVFNCSHNSCAQRDWHALRELVGPGYRDRKNTYQGNGHAGVNGQHSHVAPNVKAEPKRFPIYTSAQLAAMEFSVDAIIENAMITGQPGGLFGGGKMLKTMLAVDAGVSVATGTHFLGCDFFRVPRPMGVLIMSAESGRKALQRSALRIAAAREIELSEIDNLFWSDRVPYLGTAEGPELVGRQIAELGIKLVFFDPTYMMLDPKDSGNLFAQGMQLRRILDATREQGADFQLIHHTTRAASKLYEPPNLSDAAWAGFPEFVGQWMLVARRERYMAGSGLHKLWLELGARGEHQAGWAVDVNEHADQDGRPQGWSVSVRPAAQAQDGQAGDKARQRVEAAEQKLESDRRAIIAVAAKFPNGETNTTIRDRVSVSPNRFNVVWDTLIDDETIIEATKARKGNGRAFPTYKLRADSDD